MLTNKPEKNANMFKNHLNGYVLVILDVNYNKPQKTI